MTHKGGRLLSTLVCFLFSYLTLTGDLSEAGPLTLYANRKRAALVESAALFCLMCQAQP